MPVPPPAPIITSANTASIAENMVLAHSLTANESVTWTIIGGADNAQFEINGATLRWAGNTVRDYETPADADTNNTYLVQIRAVNGSNITADQIITITVSDVIEAGGAAYSHDFGGDTLPLSQTGATFSNWWNASQGTIYIYDAVTSASGYQIIFEANDGTGNNRITIATIGSTLYLNIVKVGGFEASMAFGLVFSGVPFNLALAFAANDIAATMDGAAVMIDNSAALPTPIQANFGSGPSGSNPVTGGLGLFEFYPTRHSNAAIQTATA